MRIIFVGIHNKPGMKPLDSKSKSGKLVDSVIELLGKDYQCLKTNLIDDYGIPQEKYLEAAFREWIERVDWSGNDIVVCLGKFVAGEIANRLIHTISLSHPSCIWSSDDKVEYVNDAVVKILKLKNQIENGNTTT